MKKLKLLALLLLTVALGILILQNRGPVKTAVLFTSFELPLIVLLSLTALAGFAAGLLVAALQPARPWKADGAVRSSR